MLLSIFEISLVATLIWILLLPLSMRAVVYPIPLVCCSIRFVHELTHSIETVILEAAMVVRSIRVDEQALFTVGQTTLEASLVIYPVGSIHLAEARRTALLPLALVVTSRHGC
jgi:hypothetical protein